MAGGGSHVRHTNPWWPPFLLTLALSGAVAACGPKVADPATAAAEVRTLLDHDELDAAGNLLGEAVARWPQDASLRELQGDLEMRRRHGALAEASYRKAIRLEPANRRLLVKLARSLLRQGQAREVLDMPSPEATDTVAVRAGFALVRLEAELVVGSGDFRAWREETESLWRLVGNDPDKPELRKIRERLGMLARKHDVVEAARQHAQCRKTTAPARYSVSRADQHRVVSGRVIRVGPKEKLKRPSQAAAVARDGDVVEIDAGTYEGDVAVWTRNDLTLRSRGGLAHLRAPRKLAQDKGIWVIKGDRTVVRGMEFSGARNRDWNGSGIRLEGSDLAVRESFFHDNEMGILTTNRTPASEILISRSEFRHNTTVPEAYPPGHGIYIGKAGSFTLEFSYVHGTDYGHNVKSRARVNRIRYNRIADGDAGRSSYLIDLPVAGIAEIIGNELQKGAFAENAPFISYGAEAERGVPRDNSIVVVNNTFYNGYLNAIGVSLRFAAPATVANNLFAGAPLVRVAGEAQQQHNVILTEGGMVDPKAGDFRLTADSPAIDPDVGGAETTSPDVGSGAAGEKLPDAQYEYVHPMRGRARASVWRVDAGAHEYCRESDDA